MAPNDTKTEKPQKSSVNWIFFILIIIGLAAFIYGIIGDHPEKAWQAYLINFLLWSAIAQGAVLFSAVMHMTKARWSGPLSGLSESFAAFFPLASSDGVWQSHVLWVDASNLIGGAAAICCVLGFNVMACGYLMLADTLVAELSLLSDRELHDIGIRRVDIRRFARRAVAD